MVFDEMANRKSIALGVESSATVGEKERANIVDACIMMSQIGHMQDSFIEIRNSRL